jgi:hypothetical protein
MKKLLIIGILSMGIFATSCDKDDECIAGVAVGTYVGTKECDERNPENVSFQVVVGSSDINLIIDGISVMVDECDIFGSTVVQGNGREIDGDIDGDKIHFVETIRVNGEVDYRCLWEGVKS